MVDATTVLGVSKDEWTVTGASTMKTVVTSDALIIRGDTTIRQVATSAKKMPMDDFMTDRVAIKDAFSKFFFTDDFFLKGKSKCLTNILTR